MNDPPSCFASAFRDWQPPTLPELLATLRQALRTEDMLRRMKPSALALEGLALMEQRRMAAEAEFWSCAGFDPE